MIHTQQELAAAYIKGELSSTALADFETALDKNKQLQNEVLFQKKLLSALKLDAVEVTVKQAKADNLLEDKTRHPEVEHIYGTMQQARIENNRQKRIKHWLIGGLAAACVFLIGIFGLHQYTVNPQYAEIEHEIENLVVNFDAPDPGYETISGTMNAEKNIQIAKEQYAAGKLEEALATLNVIPEEKLSDRILLAKAKIHAKLKDYEKSSQLLLDVTKSYEDTIKDEARLALGIVYLRMGKKEKAGAQLKQINTRAIKKEADRIIQTYF